MRRHRARRTGGFRRRALAAGRVPRRRGHGARAVGPDVAVPSPGKCARAFRRPVGPGVPRPVRSAVDDGRVAVTQPDQKWLLGGALVSWISWRWIFFVNLPIGAFALALTLLRVGESRDENSRQPDWPGFVLFTAALASLVYALIESGRTGFTSTRVLACFAAAAVLL